MFDLIHSLADATLPLLEKVDTVWTQLDEYELDFIPEYPKI